MASSVLERIDDWPVPHAAAAIVRADGVVALRGHHRHSFRIASISKVLTAYAALIAVEEGTIALDDPAGPPGSTVRHLLAHASGLGFDVASKPIAAVGARRIYSNEGIEALVRHLEVASGMPFTDYLSESLLEPLHLGSTELRGSPAFGIWSDLGDLSVFAQELLTPVLLAPETAAAMTTVQFPGLRGVLPGVGRFADLAWGLGVEIKADKSPHWSGSLTSPATFGHFGGTGTFLWVDPTRGLACVALADREFDEWGMAFWPEFNDAVITAYGDR